MLSTLNTLLLGSTARAEDGLRTHFALDIIDQKIREAEAQQRAAKSQLALLIQRQRTEQKLLGQLTARIADLTDRATQALTANREDLAAPACAAIAQMENERDLRLQTQDQLDGQVLRLRNAVETSHRTLLDLRQGNLRARALRREQAIRAKLGGSLRHYNPAEEARTLIEKVLERDDPAETLEILAEIDADLQQSDPSMRLARAGFGDKPKVSSTDIMARLRAQTDPSKA